MNDIFKFIRFEEMGGHCFLDFKISTELDDILFEFFDKSMMHLNIIPYPIKEGIVTHGKNTWSLLFGVSINNYRGYTTRNGYLMTNDTPENNSFDIKTIEDIRTLVKCVEFCTKYNCNSKKIKLALL